MNAFHTYVLFATHIKTLPVDSPVVQASIDMIVEIAKRDDTVLETLRLLDGHLEVQGADLEPLLTKYELGSDVDLCVELLHKKLEFGQAVFDAVYASRK